MTCKLIFAFLFSTKVFINVDPSRAVRITPLTSIRIEPATVLHASRGEYSFGERVHGERFLPPAQFIHVSRNILGGVRQYKAVIKSPNKEKITFVILRSMLGSESKGERVHEIGFSPNRDSVTIKFWSKPNHGIDFIVNLFGR